MIRKIFTADDFGKYQEGDQIILNSQINRVSVMVDRGHNFSTLKNQNVGLHADFGGENLSSFFSLVFKKKYLTNELDRQINKFIQIFKRQPAHLDSHRYLHLHPLVFPIFLKACEKYKIPYLRMSKKGVVKVSNLTSFIVHGMIKIDNLLYKNKIKNLAVADYLLSLDWYKNIDFKLPDGTIKVIFHPENDANLLKQLQNK